jgi:hypothetical protein
VPEGPVWPRLDAPLWLSPLRTRGSRLFDLPDGNCAARSTTHVRLPVVAASLLRECEPSRSCSRWFSAERRDLSESSEFAVHAARVSRQYRLAALFNNRLTLPGNDGILGCVWIIRLAVPSCRIHLDAGSKITPPPFILMWLVGAVEDSVARSDSRVFGVAGSFWPSGFASIVW